MMVPVSSFANAGATYPQNKEEFSQQSVLRLEADSTRDAAVAGTESEASPSQGRRLLAIAEPVVPESSTFRPLMAGVRRL